MGERPDQQPGFWCEYQEPTPIARAIQMPMHPLERWVNGVLNAHISRTSRAALREQKDASQEARDA